MASNPPRWGSFPTVRCTLYNCMLYANTAFGRPSGRVGRAFSRGAPHALRSWPPQAVPIPRAGTANRGMHTQPPAASGLPRSPRIAMRIAKHQDSQFVLAFGQQGRARRAGVLPQRFHCDHSVPSFFNLFALRNCNLHEGRGKWLSRHKTWFCRPQPRRVCRPQNHIYSTTTSLRVCPSRFASVGHTSFCPSPHEDFCRCRRRG